jgi:chemotaxis protein methyltransferase CheR
VAGDPDCISFLQWALPRLRLQWRGFRKVRRLVCKRATRRARELGLGSLVEYRAYLESTPQEWIALDGLCRIPISRFYRDRALFDALRSTLLLRLAGQALGRGAVALRAWSAGCASGEEPYTLSFVWELDVRRHFPTMGLSVLATDVDETMLERAERGCYGAGSLKQLPPEWVPVAFRHEDGLFCVRDELRACVTFRREDIRTTLPDGPFDLVMCRNLALTYFEPELQRTVIEGIVGRIVRGGLLIVGCHECPPEKIALRRSTASPWAWVREE